MRIKLRLAALIGMALFIFSACSSPKAETKPVDMDKLKVEIQAMEDAFSAGEKAKDVNAVAVYYSDDAISYSRNKAPSVGKAAIKEAIAKNIAEDTTGEINVYKVVDLFAEGNMAVEIGSWNTTQSDGTPKDNGHYMSFFQKRDGKYVCVRDMNASSNAAKK